MFKRIVMAIGSLIGLSFGLTVGPSLWREIPNAPKWLSNYYFNAIIFSILFMILFSLLSPLIQRLITRTTKFFNELSTSNLILGTIGVIIGLTIGFLLSIPFSNLEIPFVSSTLPLILSLVLAVIGYQTALSRKDEWRKLFNFRKAAHEATNPVVIQEVAEAATSYKILDTSVIIDGRIIDIVRTQFLEGTLLIPNFVLNELQFIADSSDSLKRAKGRRGLDILNQLQREQAVPIEFYEGDFPEIPEVDSKLVKLAKTLGGAILTNDYNLNKVSEFQKVKVLNINALANAVKPVVIPGEEMTVQVIKEGTERKQGVAYLDDGTMIVVEDGQYHMNEFIDVVVTSALQTAAGRMIFAKPINHD